MTAASVIPFPVVPRPVRPASADPGRYGEPFRGTKTWAERRFDAARFLNLAADSPRDFAVRWSGEPDADSFYGPYDPIRRAWESVGVDLSDYRGATVPMMGSTAKLVSPETVALLFGEAFVAQPKDGEVQAGDVVVYFDDRALKGEGAASLGYLPMMALDARERVGVCASMRFGRTWETDWYRLRRAMVWRLREERCVLHAEQSR